MSVENHPNLHVVDLMFKIESAISECLRGNGVTLTKPEILEIAKECAEHTEEVVDSRIEANKIWDKFKPVQ